MNTKSRKNSFIGVWGLRKNEWTLERYKKVANKPVTAFHVSGDGRWIGFGSSDLSVTVLDSSLYTIKVFKNAHGFPVTCIGFGKNDLLASGSAVFRLIILKINIT